MNDRSEMTAVEKAEVLNATTEELTARALLAIEELAIRTHSDVLWAAVRELRPKTDGYRIALRPDHDGYLDDVVVNDVECFRMEDMGDHWWLCCYLAGSEERIVFNVGHQGHSKARIVASIGELPLLPGLVYEEGADPRAVTKP